MISRHAGQLAESPQDPPDAHWPPREGGVGDEREADASDRKQQQKKKKKRRPRDESFDYVEVRGHSEPQGENTPPSDGSFRSPRKDGGWEREDGGRSGGGGGGGGRVKKGKSRKKIPEEWAVNAEPFVPASVAAAAAQSQEFGGELPEEGAIPASLTQDLLCLTTTPPPAAPANQAPAFSPKAVVTSSPMPEGSFSMFFQDSLMDADGSCQGDPKEVYPVPMELGGKADLLASPLGNTNPFLADSGVYDETSLFAQDHSFTGSSADATGRDPMLAFQSTGLDLPMEALISAPPFTPSGAVWSLNDSQQSNHENPFGIPGMASLDFGDTPSPAPAPAPTSAPAPLASPTKEKTAKDGYKPGRKSRTSSSSSSSAKSPTSPGAKLPSPQNSGLNPAAPPFFPSFAELPEPLAALPGRLEGLLWSGAWSHSPHRMAVRTVPH